MIAKRGGKVHAEEVLGIPPVALEIVSGSVSIVKQHCRGKNSHGQHMNLPLY